MKHLVWLLLLVCTTAFARVQPVELPIEQDSCCCCESTGACGMPDCAPPPVQVVVTLDRPATEQRETAQKKAAQPARAETLKFYAPYLTAAQPEYASLAKDEPALATAPPLRVTQCSWLI